MSIILNEIAQSYHQAVSGWHQYLFPIAQHIFGMLAVIEIAWSGIEWSIYKKDVESLWTEFLKKMLLIGFFYTLLVYAQTWIPAIIRSFMQIGAGASHVSALYPSDVLDQGMSIAASVMQPLLKAGLLQAGVGLIVGSVTAFIVIISFALIAAELIVSLVESYIVVGAGIILLGFSANRFTSAYASKYLNYAMSIGVKLFVLYLIIGIGSTLATHWGALLIQAGAKNMSPFFEVIGGSLVFLYIAKNIPNKAESLLSGTVNTNGGGLAALTAGAAFLATRSTINSSYSGYQVVQQASMVSGHHNHSPMGMLKGAMTAGINLGSAAAGSHSGHYRTTGNGMSQHTRSLEQSLAEKKESTLAEKNKR